MLKLKKNKGETYHQAVGRIARTRENEEQVQIILMDYHANLADGMSENDAAIDTLLGWDFNDVAEEVDDGDHNESWGLAPNKEKK